MNGFFNTTYGQSQGDPNGPSKLPTSAQGALETAMEGNLTLQAKRDYPNLLIKNVGFFGNGANAAVNNFECQDLDFTAKAQGGDLAQGPLDDPFMQQPRNFQADGDLLGFAINPSHQG